MTHRQDLPQFEDHKNQDHRYTTCYMCACRCGIKVTVEDEKIRDTLIDLHNYAAMAIMLMDEKEKDIKVVNEI